VASPNAPLDIADLNPAFAPYLNRYTAALDKAGIGYRVDSGYRSPEQQAEIYARSNQGRSFAAAPPWRSFHNFGLAADVIPNNPADYARMHELARQAGLYDAQQGAGFTGYDPPHVEMPGRLSNLIDQYHLAGWRPESHPAPATGALAYNAPLGQPGRPGTPTPGASRLSPLDILLQAESGDRNINNTTQGTSSGQAQGNAQITTGTWNDFAPKAGIDLKKYPTPDSAPRDIQLQVANTIPLNRWASSTVNKILAQYPGIDTSQTLGTIQSAALKNGVPTSPAPGTTLNSSPVAAAAPGAATPPQQQLAGFTPGSPAEKSMLAAGKTLGLDGGQGAGAAPKPDDFRLQPISGAAPSGGPMMMGPGGQNVQGQRLAQQANAQQMAQWGMAPPTMGTNFTPTLGPMSLTQQPQQPGAATGMPAMPGTTLNSPSQLQMAMMSGSLDPYSMYARQPGS
jgi:hypothetical protein